MDHPKNMVFSRMKNLNIENYHDTKKVDSKPENFTYVFNVFARDKNLTKAPSAQFIHSFLRYSRF